MQAQRLAERLSCVPLTAVYTSPLQRARQTAEAIAIMHDLPVQVEVDLREIDYGDWEGIAVPELGRCFPEAEQTRINDPLNFAAPNGEPFAHFIERVTLVMQRIVKAHLGETICVIAHQCVNRIVLCWVLQAPFSAWRKLRQNSGCINLFQVWGDGLWRLSLANDTCHLNDK